MTSVEEYLAASAVFIGTFIVIRLVTKQRINDGRRHPPSLPSLPVVGSIPFLDKPERFHIFLAEKANQLGNVFTMKLGSNLIVVINKRDAIHEALVKKSLDFADRPVYQTSLEFNSKMSGIIEHPYNTEFRNFHQLSISILKEFGFGRGIMETRIALEVEDLIKSLKKLECQPIYPDKLVACSVLNVITSILFNTRYHVDDDELKVIMNLVHAFLRDSMEVILVNYFPLLNYLPKVSRILKQNFNMQTALFEVFERRTKEGLKEDAEDSFVKRYVQAEGENYDREQLTFIIRDLVFAGADTSNTTLQWALVMLANNPDIQDRLQEDIDSVVPRDRLPSLDDKANMPYVEAAILELMRWRTLVPMALPHKTTCDTEVDGYFIPAGATVFVNLYSAHTDPKLFPEPDKYKPERFLDESGQVINRELMMSFSLGRRSCLGELLARQELYLIFTGLLQQFHIRPPEGQTRVDVSERVSVTNSPSYFEIRFIPRDNQ